MTSKTTSVSLKTSSNSSQPLPSVTTPRCQPTPRNFSKRTPRSRTPGDRYVPNRSTGDMDFSRFQVSTPSKFILKSSENLARNHPTPSGSSCSSKADTPRSSMRECLLALKGQSSENKVLSFHHQLHHQAPTPKYDYWRNYSATSPISSPVKKSRKLPKSADKVLDAPNLINDFYLNLLDWNKQDMVSIALGPAVYIFHASQGDVHQLCDLSSLSVTSLQWNRSGSYLAVGTSDAEIQVWDVNASKCVRKMRSHESRVSSLSWRPKSSLLSSGSQDGQIHNYDPRMAQFHVHTLAAHKLDVCGLKWSTNGRFLASGGNDNVVNIWDTYDQDPWTVPHHSFKTHTAAVKALSWCPWRPNILASGGGSADKTICLWNACNGESQGKVVTDSQVSGLVWSSEHRELLSCHGNPTNSLQLWKWHGNDRDIPLHQEAELVGHEGRILHIAASPDGQTVATAGADETLRFWKCFENGKKKTKKSTGATSSEFNISKYMR